MSLLRARDPEKRLPSPHSNTQQRRKTQCDADAKNDGVDSEHKNLANVTVCPIEQVQSAHNFRADPFRYSTLLRIWLEGAGHQQVQLETKLLNNARLLAIGGTMAQETGSLGIRVVDSSQNAQPKLN